MTNKNKNGETVIKYDCDYYDHFSEWSGWTCNICGDTLPEDERDMIEHMEVAHDQKIRYNSKEWCDKYE